MFSQIRRDLLHIVVPAMVRWLTPVAERTYGRYTVADWIDQALRGEVEVWAGYRDDEPFVAEDPDVVIVTQIVQYPRLRALRIVACGGRRFFALYPEIEDVLLRGFGPRTGCVRYEIVGRSGWQKVLQRFGPVNVDTVTDGALEGVIGDEQGQQGTDAADGTDGRQYEPA
jgi:hypothetical protein